MVYRGLGEKKLALKQKINKDFVLKFCTVQKSLLILFLNRRKGWHSATNDIQDSWVLGFSFLAQRWQQRWAFFLNFFS